MFPRHLTSFFLACVLLVAAVAVSFPPSWAIAQCQQVNEELPSSKIELEVIKLQEEIRKFRADAKNTNFDVTKWLSFIVGFLGLFSAAWVALANRRGSTNAEVHKKRMEIYPNLIAATAPLALFFPHEVRTRKSALSAKECEKMGRALSEWYFTMGGALMSKNTRGMYFRLVRALTLASSVPLLCADNFRLKAEQVSVDKFNGYRSSMLSSMSDKLGVLPSMVSFQKRSELFLTHPFGSKARENAWTSWRLASADAVEAWSFGHSIQGNSGSASADPASAANPWMRFKDFVFLQNLSSQLRTALTLDLRGRRRPD
jgi:hypothetical protein